MIVISDTSCISALIQTNLTNLLPALFGEVIVPEPVFQELLELNQFGIDVGWLSSAPWLIVQQAKPGKLLFQLLEELDSGEAHAIALSLEIKADLLIIDERKGRAVAESFQIVYTGLGGVLIRAKFFGLIPDVKTVLERIETETNFYLSEKVKAIILHAVGETS